MVINQSQKRRKLIIDKSEDISLTKIRRFVKEKERRSNDDLSPDYFLHPIV